MKGRLNRLRLKPSKHRRSETEGAVGRTSSIACGRGRQSTFSPPDLGAVAVATATMAVQSYRTGQALFWIARSAPIVSADSSWAER